MIWLELIPFTMKDKRDRATLLILKKSKTKAEKIELRHYLSLGIYKKRPQKWTFKSTPKKSPFSA